jgi:Flp pilus assembly protein TadG
MRIEKLSFRRSERGATVVEFAVVTGIFFMLLIGIMEMGRVLFYWNTATEATRLGARIAVVCDLNDTHIKAKMISLFPTLNTSDISLNYQPAGCTAANCQQVTVSIVPGKNIATYIPYVPMALTMPAFTTTLSRESLQSTFNGMANPVCN